MDDLKEDEIGDLLLEEKKLFIQTLIIQHYSLDSKHALNRKKRCERGKLNYQPFKRAACIMKKRNT